MIWVQGSSQDCTLANAQRQFMIPMTLDFHRSANHRLAIKYSGSRPPTRDTPGSSAGGIVRLPIVCQGTPFSFGYLNTEYVLEYLTFTIPRIPHDPRDPRVPGFWSPTVTCQTCLRKGVCWCLQSPPYSVQGSHQI